MKKLIHKRTYELSPEGIDLISDQIEMMLREYPVMTRKDIFRQRLSAEEMLMRWMNTATGLEVELTAEETKSELYLTMKLEGITFRKNPLYIDDSEGLGIVDSTMASLGIGWLFQYDRGSNVVYTRISITESNAIKDLVVLVTIAAVITAVIKIMPNSVEECFQTYIIGILFNYGCKFLTAIISPMMFLSIIAGVMSVGSPRYLQDKGKFICERFLRETVIIILAAAVVGMVAFPFHPDFSTEKEGAQLLQFIADVVPENIVDPFMNGNMIQIIFMGVVVGMALLYLQRQAHTITHLVEEGNALMMRLVTAFNHHILAWFFVLSLVDLGLSANVQQFRQFGKMLIINTVFVVAVVTVQMILTSRKIGVPMKEIWEKLRFNALERLNSASSSVVFAGAYEDCEKKFGVDKQLVSFALPVGTVIHKPFIASEMILMVCSIKAVQGEDMSITSMLLLVFLAFVVSIAYPPISGGELTCYTILLAQMGLPAKYLTFVCTLSSISDLIESPSNTISTEMRVIVTAEELKKREHLKRQRAKIKKSS